MSDPPKDHSWCAPFWKEVDPPSEAIEANENEPGRWAVCLPCFDANKKVTPKRYGTGQERGNAWKHTTRHHLALKPVGWGTSCFIFLDDAAIFPKFFHLHCRCMASLWGFSPGHNPLLRNSGLL